MAKEMGFTDKIILKGLKTLNNKDMVDKKIDNFIAKLIEF